MLSIWDKFLPQAVWATRVRKHSVTKKSPFYLVYGVEPRIPGNSTPPYLWNFKDDDDTIAYREREIEGL
jgi:hypothetical protein